MLPLVATLAVSQPNLAALDAQLIKIAQPFKGRLGYCVIDLKSGARISYRGTELFPTASTIKTSVVLEALCQVDEGKRKMSDKFPLPPLDKRQGSMWTYAMREGTQLDIDGYANLALGVSDNTATMVLQNNLSSKEINARMAKLGLLNTKILGNRTDRDAAETILWKKYGWGVTTPREQARLYELLYKKKAGTAAVSEKLMRILSRQYWDDIVGASTPIDVKWCAKSGAVNQSRSEVAIVFATRPYVVAMYTADQQDQRWAHDNEGEVALRKIAVAVWNTFEPKRPFSLPSGYDKFEPTGGGQ